MRLGAKITKRMKGIDISPVFPQVCIVEETLSKER